VLDRLSDLTRLILGARQTPPRLPWICGSERAPRPWRDRSASHGADTRDRYQAPAHIIVPNDGQQAAVQGDVCTRSRPDNEQRFDQNLGRDVSVSQRRSTSAVTLL